MIVVAGEALHDLVVELDGTRVSLHPGGGPFNAARTVGRLGGDVAFLGRLSDDELGRRLRARLEEDGVLLDTAIRTSDPTTLALAELTGRNAVYRFYTTGASAAGLTPTEAVGALPDDLGALHVGTLGLVLEPTADAVEALVTAVGEDVVVLVDPNCRPAAISDPARYRERLDRILGRADVVKSSEDDLAWLAPDRDTVGAARQLLERGPRVVLVTRGPRDALVVTGDDVDRVVSPDVEVVDTIGAGDAFSGAFLAWWQREELGREALRDPEALVAATGFACGVAARTCERAGAEPPTAAEVGW